LCFHWKNRLLLEKVIPTFKKWVSQGARNACADYSDKKALQILIDGMTRLRSDGSKMESSGECGKYSVWHALFSVENFETMRSLAQTSPKRLREALS